MALNIPQVPRRLSLRNKPPSDPAKVPAFLKELVEALNQQNELVSSAISGLTGADVLANRPASQIAGRLFYATDAAHLYVDTGSTWIQLI